MKGSLSLRPVHVAIVLPNLESGGAERVTLRLAVGLRAAGFRVDMVLLQAEGRLLAHVPPEVRVIDLGASRASWSLLALARYLRNAKPDVVVSALDHASLAVLAAKKLARSHVPIVAVVHTTLAEHFGRAGSLKKRLVLPFLIRRCYGQAYALVAVSAGAASSLRQILRRSSAKIISIPNAVVDDDLWEQSSAAASHPWCAGDRHPLVLGAGCLAPHKGFPHLIEAFALVRKRIDARLIIIGEGPERERLRGMAASLGLAEFVDLPGFQVNPYPFFRRADVFVVSSLYEGLPTVLIEALALGTPVVATDCSSGPREILEGGRWGALVPVGDTAALASALVDAIQRCRPAVPNREAFEKYVTGHAVAQYAQLLRLAAAGSM